MKKCFLLIIASILLQQTFAQTSKEVYLFSYFKNNGQDGLHLAFSEDGFKWTALKNDSSFLNPDFAVAQFMSVCLRFVHEYAT